MSFYHKYTILSSHQMESPRLRRMIREHSSSSITIKPRSRHVSECEPLKINVIKSSKYVGPPEIPNCYPLFSSPRGHVLIINNERFNEKTSDGSNYRKGSEVDGCNLETLFTGLGFVVEVHRNLTGNQIANTMRDFSDSDKHLRADMAVVAILSHGTEGFLYGTDRRSIEMEWLIQQLNNENCVNLRGKPKFFIFQACRGHNQDYGTPTRLSHCLDESGNIEVLDIPERTTTDAEIFNIPPCVEVRSPTVEDFLIACSTIPGYVSNRDTVRGSWFIECICKVFMTLAATTDIRDMLDKVSLEMSSYISECGTKQTCSYEVRHFYKKLYFNPGIGPSANVAKRRSSLHSSPITRPRSISDPFQLQFSPLQLQDLMLHHNKVKPILDEIKKVPLPEEISLSRKPSSRRSRTQSIGDAD